ncbi:response regulator receiver domain-containing protein [Christiangramia gaetbulicola]|uniref:Response regulator receiver domain-containing protein n=1 Tax=Christiangramia gaetbulicola TaxID=703340 RepID=A0A2T6AIK1_9FLAO|nr:response regulator [Christiangramia gaetbulicola]PTX43617.1 response regulator receiver domain-containing protein [Christiangramia gaetbulicola]
MKKVLVIQEDIIILKILERLTRLNGFDCKAIRSLSALNIEDQQTNFDFIITDILFEGIAPLQFVAQVQEVLLHKNLLIVTNMGQDKIKQEIFNLRGITGFYAVPIDLDEIEAIIQAY